MEVQNEFPEERDDGGKMDFVLCTPRGSSLDRDKDTVLDPGKMPPHFSVFL